MKSHTEMTEGLEAFKQFDAAMTTLLSVPHSELVRREAEYRKQVEANPNRRGPKRKAKTPSASRASTSKG
jgi:hypothetical protein